MQKISPSQEIAHVTHFIVFSDLTGCFHVTFILIKGVLYPEKGPNSIFLISRYFYSLNLKYVHIHS